MKRFDVNCFSGPWPFHSSRNYDCNHLAAIHGKNGISGGLVTSLQTIFYLDPLTAARDLQRELPAGYGQVFSINPNLPAADELCMEAMEKYQIKGIRLLPTFHDFDWLDARTQAVLTIAQRRKLPIFITLNLEDARLDYLLQQNPVKMDDLASAIADLPDVPVIITNAYLKNIKPLASAICSRENIFADTSSLNSPLLALDQAFDMIGSEHLMYGSGAYVQALSSSVQNLAHCDLSDSQLQAIWYDNAARIFELL